MPVLKVYADERVPIKIWSANAEEQAIKQLKNIANLPFVFKHVAAMPDVHLGIGATVGSVITTDKAICPAAVGVDIGCGMMAVKTTLDYRVVQDKVVEIRKSIERSIPVGHESNRRITEEAQNWKGWKTPGVPDHIGYDQGGAYKKALSQLGSLGGGNHFIELCTDQDNAVWIMLHSGSRNIGKVIAEHHITKAKGLMEQMFISLPDPDLAYFAQGTSEFKQYVADVEWCQRYAMANREEMMRRILKDLSYTLNSGAIIPSLCVNCHHNYLARENHYNKNVIVTRKGAVRARIGDLGIIPGSMGTKSYIVEGLGNPESFCSCSHGAGRRMSRAQARKTFTTEDLKMQTAGVECRKDGGVLDEIPGAYKDIDEVMSNQKDLVKVIATLKQFMCIKG
jgi:tRNA-splicing ligase RtcB (3'-phosphate/5'-hydroxy nucleic acid ligase)